MADGKPVRVGAKVEVVGKDVVGTVAYIGTTLFSSGNMLLTRVNAEVPFNDMVPLACM